MAVESIQVKAGSGADPAVAADIAGGIYYQVTKMAFGSDGTATLVENAAPLPVAVPNAPATNDNMSDQDYGLPVRMIPTTTWRSTFSKVISNNVDTGAFTLLATGSGQTVNQSSGNLVITAGTTANSETVIRSNVSWRNSIYLRFGHLLSQRIAQNNFFMELVDVVGDALAFTINSATSITVTFPTGTNPFTSQNVGQSMYIGVISGAAGIPGRWAIASISGDTVNFTVAGWPGSGSGTLSLYGWNYHHVLYDGTTATSSKYDGQRKGWNTGDTTITTVTSASPGHAIQLYTDGNYSYVLDALVASGTTFPWTQRGSRLQNIPPPDVELFLQIRCMNGTTNPASGTTWTINYVSVEEFVGIPVVMEMNRPIGAGSALSVQVQNTPAVTQSGTWTVQPGNTANTTAWLVSTRPTASTTGANTKSRTTTTLSTNATSVKASAGMLYDVEVTNTDTNPFYLKFYNKASAPTVGTDTPTETLLIPASSTQRFNWTQGNPFTTGLAFATTSLSPDSDTTVVAAGSFVHLKYS